MTEKRAVAEALDDRRNDPLPGPPSAIDASDAPGGPASFGEVLSAGPFRSLWIAQIVSQLAQNLTWITLGAFVEKVTGKATLVSVTTASALLAPLLFSAVAGVIVDRSGKRTILLGSNVLRVLLTGLFIMSTMLAPAAGTTAIIVLIFLANVVSQFFSPAEAAAIPLLVERRNIIVASSLFNITFNACQLVPVMFGLLLFNIIGIVPILVLIGVLYGIATVLVAGLPPQADVSTASRAAGSARELVGYMVEELKEAFRFLADHPHLRLVLFQINVAPTFVFVFLPLGLKFVPDTFGLDAAHTWILLCPAGLGIALGAALMGKLSDRMRKETLINVGLLAMGTAIAVLGGMASLVVHGGAVSHAHLHNGGLLAPAIVLALIIGLGMAMSSIPAQTLVLEQTAEELRGRVLSIQLLVNAALPLIPLLTVGYLADRWGTASVMLGLGVIIGVIGVWSARLPLDTRGDG